MTNVADARAELYRIKQARQPITEAIDHLQEHIEITTKQLEDTRVVDEAMQQAEDRAQERLDAALEGWRDQHIDINIRHEPGSTADAAAQVIRKIKDQPQA
ncbi:hypothetical protein SEA_PIPPA_44 [Arthrobacter phage Pippa]|nr:hypothetical protein SEA_PIPPA_44 [Arthrobacter phage Pippa]